ncbi:MAG TPA: hypothetical protein VET66_08740 [Steroidobacteraceae bacterium]|nr:hypothetical protein [Steroidobacteraceae bacterium]
MNTNTRATPARTLLLAVCTAAAVGSPRAPTRSAKRAGSRSPA